ncbi:MAG TPA: type I-U CRISPR-associated RAMP protein Csb1/Cas7u [Verrucomicrobiae bacterium]|nr:type I-U CRISPR-associated RAMP protein Csb1/Cas7u [Verrucomicrobiae bacterium]
MNTPTPHSFTLPQLLASDGPACLIIKAQFDPLGDQDRFQPAGFPEMGHVIYDAPRTDEMGKSTAPEKVCIVDSAASMANHLEALCFANPAAAILHPDLNGLPYVRCVTDDANGQHTRLICTTLTEGHRIASDYFLRGRLNNRSLREELRHQFGIVEISRDETYFITPENWWTIYTTVFRYDPNSLVHGVLFAKEQIKVSRLLTAHLEAFGAARVGSAGVKFDRLGRTTSGQPIFSKDEETAHRIEAIFLIDLGLLRSYGHNVNGLNGSQKRFLLELALWKVQRMLATPFRFRSGCHLRCVNRHYTTEDEAVVLNPEAFGLDIQAAIRACNFGENPVNDVYYPANELFNPQTASDVVAAETGAGGTEEKSDQPEA